jgi:hypothetical protein
MKALLKQVDGSLKCGKNQTCGKVEKKKCAAVPKSTPNKIRSLHTGMVSSAFNLFRSIPAVSDLNLGAALPRRFLGLQQQEDH